MKFSEQWLRAWINPDMTTEQLAHQLTMAGLEVDAIEPVAGEFSKIVVGEVLKVEPHPDADKLRVCQVNVGETESLTIVCGAANVREGLKVPAALVGARLPGDFKIKKSKLRGVPSHGMLCSAKELGLAEQAEGLMELPDDAPVAEDIREYLDLNDTMIELGLTPNRGDCLSIAGIAREVGVLNKMAVTEAEIPSQEATIDDAIAIKLNAEGDCPHYVGRIIRGINPNAETPLWIQECLRRSGLRSLGPVVDVTNYVLLELGQPMHAFDLAKIHGGIKVRHAKQGESLTLLDEQDVELQPGTLLIADDKQPLAMAGIMGGLDSAVGDSTVDILLESAYFNPLAIAGRARSYGLHTDSSHRFERGVSAELQIKAIERATRLLLDIVGGQVGPVCEEVIAKALPARPPVVLRVDRITRVLGTQIAKKDCEDILSRLGMVLSNKKTCWEVVPPAFRFDIEIEEDLIEELGRIHGYDNLPSSRPHVQLHMPAQPEARVGAGRIKQVLVDLGYAEAITYSFVDPKLETILDPDVEPLKLANPISSDMAVMRTSLWPGLIQALQYNLNRQQNRIFLFECGLKFVPQATNLKQEMVVAGAMSGDVTPAQWGQQPRAIDFYDAKAHLETLLELTGKETAFSFEKIAHPALHPGQSAAIMFEGRQVGLLGALHPRVQQALDVSQRVFVFEIEEAVLHHGTLPAYASLSRFPSIRRDIAIVVDDALPAQEIMTCIENVGCVYLTNIELFDVYNGEGIDSGRKSLALGLTLQDLSRTLKESEVEAEIDQIKSELKSKLGATLRE